MKLLCIIFISLISLKGFSQLYPLDNLTQQIPASISDDFLDKKMEIIGGKEKLQARFQRKFILPFELHDTLCSALSTQKILVYASVQIDTMGNTHIQNITCPKLPFMAKYIENLLIEIKPQFVPGIYEGRKIKTNTYFIFILKEKEKEKIKEKEKNKYFKFYMLYPVFEKKPQ